MIFNEIPGDDVIEKTLASIMTRGIKAELAGNRERALERVISLIPAGADVMTGGSVTLAQIGLEAMLVSGSHPWHNVKAEVLAEKDPVMQVRRRRQSTLTDYFVGSVHAITADGEVVVASATGSQLAAYVYSSPNIIWVAGAQKITATLDEAFKRVRDYVFPLENERMKKINGTGSFMSKLLIFEREAALLKRNITLIIVRESLGF